MADQNRYTNDVFATDEHNNNEEEVEEDDDDVQEEIRNIAHEGATSCLEKLGCCFSAKCRLTAADRCKAIVSYGMWILDNFVRLIGKVGVCVCVCVCV